MNFLLSGKAYLLMFFYSIYSILFYFFHPVDFQFYQGYFYQMLVYLMLGIKLCFSNFSVIISSFYFQISF